MHSPSRWVLGTVISLALIAGGIPPALAWLALYRAPVLLASEALQRLNQAGSNALLVDVRPAGEFAAGHVSGAVSWPLGEIAALGPGSPLSGRPLPAETQGRALILICAGGWESAQAARLLEGHGVQEVYSVRGGMQEWTKAAWHVQDWKYSHLSAPGKADFLPVQKLPPGEQAAQLLAGFVIKPLYMLISLGLAGLLMRRRAADLQILGWGMLIFFIGEAFCYLNFLVYGDDSYLSEYLHSYGMVLGFACAAYALLEGLETRLLRVNPAERRCALAGLCGTCWKAGAGGAAKSPSTCRARRIAWLAIPCLAVVGLIPLAAPFSASGYTGLVFGFPYYYARFYVYQAYETRYLPLLALACFGLAYLPLWLDRQTPLPLWTRIFSAGGLGALSFSLVRLGLGAIFDSRQVWFSFWEEATELLFALAVLAAVWLFRKTLLRSGQHPSAQPSG